MPKRSRTTSTSTSTPVKRSTRASASAFASASASSKKTASPAISKYFQASPAKNNLTSIDDKLSGGSSQLSKKPRVVRNEEEKEQIPHQVKDQDQVKDQGKDDLEMDDKDDIKHDRTQYQEHVTTEDEFEADADTSAPASTSSSSSSSSSSSKVTFSSSSITTPNLQSLFDFTPSTMERSNYAATFAAIADACINHYVLVATNKKGQEARFRMIEIEFYYCGFKHMDLFAHQSPIQKSTCGHWYFHRQGTSEKAQYKGGTYKGLDVTIARIGEGHGGILIRSIQNVKSGVITEGSCLTVDLLLATTGYDSIAELVDTGLKGNTDAFRRDAILRMEPATDLKHTALMASPRVGLTLKKSDAGAKESYLFVPYRYTMASFYPKKLRQTLIIAKYLYSPSTFSAASICAASRTSASTIHTMTSSTDKGRKLVKDEQIHTLKSYHGITWNTDTMSQLYGAWYELYGRT